MVGQSRKWMLVAVVIWMQAFTGTNLDFSSYSSHLKSVLGISQVQLNYLSVASDLGKAFGWCSGVSLLYLPLWAVTFIAAFVGFFGYGLQWLVLQTLISLPYSLVFLLCLLAGCSICWFNTVCFVLCIRNFSTNRALALALTSSFNGLSGALYTLVANAINPTNDTLYLILNALVPLIISGMAIIPVLRQSPLQPLPANVTRRESLIFLYLYILAALIGVYLLCLNFLSSNAPRARFLLVGAIFLLILPLCLPSIWYARYWAHGNIQFSSPSNNKSFNLDDNDALELYKGFIESDDSAHHGMTDITYGVVDKEGCLGKVIEKDTATMMLGEEHPALLLFRSLNFWLYYVTYFCGGTIGLVYSNNIGQISQSLGYASQTTSLVTLYSSCSFFGRLLSATPDFLQDKVGFARTWWFAVAIVPTPIAFFLLAASGSEAALRIGTALIGLSSGFVFSAAVSITSELFGPNSAAVNHNILITNIPIGSLLYGLLAAVVYDSNEGSSTKVNLLNEATLCLGTKCYWQTFMSWGCISILGLLSSFFLFLRTRPAYDRLESDGSQTRFSL